MAFVNMKSVSALLALLLAACGDSASQVGPGGVSADDAKALDAAAAKLEDEAAGQPDTNSKSNN